MNRFQFVAVHQQRYGVKRLCQAVGIARSSFYCWKSTAAARAAREAADVALAGRIRAVHAAFDGTYGAPRITAELCDNGQRVNRKRVARVMRRFGVQGLRLRRRTRTTVPDPAAAKASDLIGRDFTAPAPNRHVGDITYLPVGERGFLYLATVIDLHSRRLAGWAIADHMRTELVIDALQTAQRTRGSLDGAIMHTDHGAQYTSRAFATACAAAGMRQSMSAVGSSADNAAAESFNATFKRETLQGRRAFTDEREARLSSFRWLHRYNTVRRHSRLGQQSPIAYERTQATSTTLANTREVLYVVNRPGNAPSHQDAAGWIDKAIDLVIPHAPRVCVRGDTDFSLTEYLDRWAQRVDFVFGMDNNTALRHIADGLEASAWSRLTRPPRYQTTTDTTRTRRANRKRQIVKEREYLNLELNFEDVATFDYRPGKCQRSYRVVALRKNISRTRGENVLFDEIRYFFYITTYTGKTPAQIVELANERCDQENIIGQLKSGINALRAPVHDLVSNWAYMATAALAWNIKAWFAMMMHRKTDRHHYIRMEFRRFFHSVVLIPAMVLRRARTITVRLIGYTPALDRLFSAWTTIERLRFG